MQSHGAAKKMLARRLGHCATSRPILSKLSGATDHITNRFETVQGYSTPERSQRVLLYYRLNHSALKVVPSPKHRWPHDRKENRKPFTRRLRRIVREWPADGIKKAIGDVKRLDELLYKAKGCCDESNQI